MTTDPATTRAATATRTSATTANPAVDPWERLRRYTPARIGLGRAGDALPTRRLLEFDIAHAQARDAVHTPLDLAALRAELAPLPHLTVTSRAADRASYLRRPDLGRRLAPEDSAPLTPAGPDVAFVIADGLSARAVHEHAIPTLRAILERLEGWHVAPIILAAQARVALGDDIGERLDTKLVVVLIGERPGLSAADSLGIYLTAHPRIGRRDSERNCISNIHPPDGLDYATAADKLTHLMRHARQLGISGVELKDDHTSLDPPTVNPLWSP